MAVEGPHERRWALAPEQWLAWRRQRESWREVRGVRHTLPGSTGPLCLEKDAGTHGRCCPAQGAEPEQDILYGLQTTKGRQRAEPCCSRGCRSDRHGTRTSAYGVNGYAPRGRRPLGKALGLPPLCMINDWPRYLRLTPSGQGAGMHWTRWRQGSRDPKRRWCGGDVRNKSWARVTYAVPNARSVTIRKMKVSPAADALWARRWWRTLRLTPTGQGAGVDRSARDTKTEHKAMRPA